MNRSISALAVLFVLALAPATLRAQVCRGISSSGPAPSAWTTVSSTSFSDVSEQRVAVTAGRLVHVTAFVGAHVDEDFNPQARLAGLSLGIDWEIPVVQGLYFCPVVGGSFLRYLDGTRSPSFPEGDIEVQEYEAAVGIAYERRVSRDVVLVGSAGVGALRMRYLEGSSFFSVDDGCRDYRERRASLGATVGRRLLLRIGVKRLDACIHEWSPFDWPYGRRSEEIAWQFEIGYALRR